MSCAVEGGVGVDEGTTQEERNAACISLLHDHSQCAWSDRRARVVEEPEEGDHIGVWEVAFEKTYGHGRGVIHCVEG